MKNKIKIIICDDKEIYRNIFRRELVNFDIEVIGEAANGQEAIDLLETLKPDILLLDLEMPVMDGNTAFEIISEKYPSVKVIILTTFQHPCLFEHYGERGVKGYIPKDAILDLIDGIPVLLNAINKVYTSGTFFYERPKNDISINSKHLEIVPMVLKGWTNEEIGKEMGITSRAVQKQKQNLNKSVGVEKSIDFYKLAFSKGLQYLGFKKKG